MNQDRGATGDGDQPFSSSPSHHAMHELLQSRALDPPLRPGVPANIERFEIQRLLGSGGMGLVFLALDPRSGQRVAIKLLKPQYASNPHAAVRFLSEARLLQRLSHPNVVSILEVWDRPDGPFFVLPFMANGSVANRIMPGQAMPEATVLRLARDMAAALAYAHAKGITHRDLKPANVLIDDQDRACLADFGLGRTVYNDPILDLPGDPPEGTPAYMAPEVALSMAGDSRCDIYGFGALLYEMLSGVPPYGPMPGPQVLQLLRQGPPMPLLQRNPHAPPDLARVVRWAMARELRDRYAQMADVLMDLQLIADHRSPMGPHGGPSL